MNNGKLIKSLDLLANALEAVRRLSERQTNAFDPAWKYNEDAKRHLKELDIVMFDLRSDMQKSLEVPRSEHLPCSEVFAAIDEVREFYDVENETVKGQFDLEKVLSFTSKHDVQIIRGEDYQYQSYIDKKCYGTSLTPIHALWFGIMSYELHEGR